MAVTQSDKPKVPALRFPEFSGEWEDKSLGEVARIFDGTHQTPSYVESGVPFYSVEHITSDNFSNTRYISEEAYQSEIRRVKLERGDILMTRIGDVGTARLIDWDVKASFYVSLALIKPTVEIDSSFTAQIFATDTVQREIWKRTIHVAFPRKINLGEIGNVSFSLPSLDEQQKVADFLGAVDERLEGLRKKRDLLREYKRGAMQKIFSQQIRFTSDDGTAFPDWERCSLLDKADLKTGNANREDSASFGKFAFFDRSNDVRFSDSYTFDCVAIIVAGEGKRFPPRFYSGKFDLHQRAYALIGFEENDPKFLYFWIEHHQANFLKYAVGSTMPSLRRQSFEKFPLMCPHADEQKKIADFLSDIDKKIEAVESQITATEAFKKGLLQQMFV